MLIGVISDTHGLIRPEALGALRGVDAILHAGDIGGQHVVAALQENAPVSFVRGNNDDADGLEMVRLTIGGLRILLTHILPRPGKLRTAIRASLSKEPADLVIFDDAKITDKATFEQPHQYAEGITMVIVNGQSVFSFSRDHFLLPGERGSKTHSA